VTIRAPHLAHNASLRVARIPPSDKHTEAAREHKERVTLNSGSEQAYNIFHCCHFGIKYVLPGALHVLFSLCKEVEAAAAALFVKNTRRMRFAMAEIFSSDI
jgi:hypothetical protein